MSNPDLSAQDPNQPVAGDPEVVSDIDLNGPPLQEEQQEESQPSGVEKRIAELTAKIHERDREYKDLQKQFVEVVGRQIQQPQKQEPVEDEFADVDPVVKKMIAQVAAGVRAEIRRETAQQTARLVVDDVAALLNDAGIDDPATHKIAKELTIAWKKQGLEFNPADVARFAIGEAAITGGGIPRQPQMQQQQAAPARRAPTTIGGGSRPAATQRQVSRPANLEDLSPEEQIAYYQKAGVGDLPL